MLANFKNGRLGYFSAAAIMALVAASALAQQPRQTGAPTGKSKVEDKKHVEVDANPLVLKAVAVSPNDPIVIVNGKAITRQRLADECVARHGKEVADTLIAKELIQQALDLKKLTVTAEEVNAEITHTATVLAHTDRETWLRELEKEKGISPSQYARDVVYPTIALRKLATPRVQVTDRDVQDAYEASFGDKLRCRVIMLQQEKKAIEFWEELQRTPNAFERIARKESIDIQSRAVGGLMSELMGRHANPRNVSDAAFAQLVDGDPSDKEHKPKDGDITGPIQLNESAWLILKREELVPADKDKDPKNPELRASAQGPDVPREAQDCDERRLRRHGPFRIDREPADGHDEAP